MASTLFGDQPGNLYKTQTLQMVALASDGTNDLYPILVAPQNIQIISGWVIPATSQAGSATHYFDINIINAGSAGTGTTVLASKTFSATTTSIASMAPGAMTLGTVYSASKGEALYVSHASQGNGIARSKMGCEVWYRLI